MAVAAHLAWSEAKGQLPQRFSLAQTTRPKIIDITNGGEAPTSPNVLTDPKVLLADTIEAVGNASFHVASDKKAAQAQLEAFGKLLHETVPEDDLEDIGHAAAQGRSNGQGSPGMHGFNREIEHRSRCDSSQHAR